MGNYYAKHNEAGREFDQDLLITELKKYYNTSDLDEITQYLKVDLVSAPKLKALMDGTRFEKEELILHTRCIFDGLFNQNMIKKIKKEMKKI